jgi:hypothetical protein
MVHLWTMQLALQSSVNTTCRLLYKLEGRPGKRQAPVYRSIFAIELVSIPQLYLFRMIVAEGKQESTQIIDAHKSITVRVEDTPGLDNLIPLCIRKSSCNHFLTNCQTSRAHNYGNVLKGC